MGSEMCIRDSSKIPNIGEVDRIYLASPRGLRWGKTEPPDYILMRCSANVPSITYEIDFGDLRPPCLKKNRIPPSCLLYTSDAADDTPCLDLGQYFQREGPFSKNNCKKIDFASKIIQIPKKTHIFESSTKSRGLLGCTPPCGVQLGPSEDVFGCHFW